MVALSSDGVKELHRLQTENAKLRELVQGYHRALTSMCEHRDCDACNLRDEGACERGVLTARACTLEIEVNE